MLCIVVLQPPAGCSCSVFQFQCNRLHLDRSIRYSTVRYGISSCRWPPSSARSSHLNGAMIACLHNVHMHAMQAQGGRSKMDYTMFAVGGLAGVAVLAGVFTLRCLPLWLSQSCHQPALAILQLPLMLLTLQRPSSIQLNKHAAGNLKCARLAPCTKLACCTCMCIPYMQVWPQRLLLATWGPQLQTQVCDTFVL